MPFPISARGASLAVPCRSGGSATIEFSLTAWRWAAGIGSSEPTCGHPWLAAKRTSASAAAAVNPSIAKETALIRSRNPLPPMPNGSAESRDERRERQRIGQLSRSYEISAPPGAILFDFA
jgi:hypothetical protein